jgi:hypothetical protein
MKAQNCCVTVRARDCATARLLAKTAAFARGSQSRTKSRLAGFVAAALFGTTAKPAIKRSATRHPNGPDASIKPPLQRRSAAHHDLLSRNRTAVRSDQKCGQARHFRRLNETPEWRHSRRCARAGSRSKGVSVAPGANTLTVMPRGASSAAHDRAMPTAPCRPAPLWSRHIGCA